MMIRVREDAASAYVRRCYKGANPQCGQLHKPEWQKQLEALSGKWIQVETNHLFRDQFNTAPIPGISDLGMRLMIEDIDAIKDDVRQGVVKCQWCYGYDNGLGVCGNCGKTEYLKPLNPISPV